MKPEDIERLTQGLHEYLRRCFVPVNDRLKALEARESKTLADSYRGSWVGGEYKRGEMTTHSGSLWLCIASTSGKPGACGDWRMIVKSGARE